MEKLILRNDFHNTEVTLRINPNINSKGTHDFTLSTGQVKKANKTLCGIKDCACSGYLGCHGGNYEIKTIVDHYNVRLEIDYNEDKSANIEILQYIKK